MNEMIVNVLDRLVPILFLIPCGYTIYYFFPRYYNFPKYKSMQLIFLIGFLMVGILLIPLIQTKFFASNPMLIPIFFIIYDSVILFLSFYLFQGKIDSTTIFFVQREDIKKLISNNLTRLDWKDIRVVEQEPDLVIFSDPNQAYTIQAIDKQDRFVVIPKINDSTSIDFRVFKRFSLNLKFDLSAYPPDPEMVTLFRRKNLKILVIFWGVFVLFQLARIFVTR
jgi:hypothetical protein